MNKMLKQVIFYMDEDMKIQAQKYLRADGITLSFYVRNALINLVRKKKKEEEKDGNF